MLVLFCFVFFCLFFVFVFLFCLFFSVFHFGDFLTTLTKDLMKKPLVFITNIKSSHSLLHFHRDLRSKNIWQWNGSPLKFRENYRETSFLCKFLPSLGNLRPVFILKCVILAKFLLSQPWSLTNFWIWSDRPKR